jgi:serine phosphatase RsbU (regulator of sigma subunit)
VALSTLNRALLSRKSSALCSVAAIAVSEDPRRPARLAVAGHPPPMLIDDGTVTDIQCKGPVLGAFADAGWDLEHVTIEPGQQLAIVTDGIAEAGGQGGRFGEDRLREEVCGAGTPVQVVQRLEGALQAFTGGILDDDVAILAISPDAPGSRTSTGVEISSATPLADASAVEAGHG